MNEEIAGLHQITAVTGEAKKSSARRLFSCLRRARRSSRRVSCHPNVEAQLAWRERIVSAGLDASEALDRCYFHSIYFRDSDEVLFEIATGPGFTADEEIMNLVAGQT